MGQMIDFKRPDGSACRGYLASAGQGKPGVVVIQEWWGLNDQICGIADRFARAGYNALAPDLFKGRVTQQPDEANHLMNGLDFPGATHQDIRGAVDHLRGIGWRQGRGDGLLHGRRADHCRRRACAESRRRRSASTASRRRSSPTRPTSGFPSRGISPARTTGARRPPRCAGSRDARRRQPPEMYRYEADHAFFNERRAEVYDAACANQAWERMLAFLGKTWLMATPELTPPTGSTSASPRRCWRAMARRCMSRPSWAASRRRA
jgi:carboxymethylenebutenolidase